MLLSVIIKNKGLETCKIYKGFDIISLIKNKSEKRKNPKYYQYLRFKTLLPKNSLGWECFFDSFFIYFFLIYINIYSNKV